MKKQSGFRRLTALALALCMLAALTSEIFAADTVASGYCGSEGDGKNLTWTLDSEGTLTISGKGEMKDYDYFSDPWVRSAVKCVSIESGVTCIGDYAFHNCTNLTGVTIPNSVTSIGGSAFSDCSSLTSITIPSSVTSIGEDVFWGCGSLTSVTIPNSVTSIGRFAFSDCSSLTSITIPSSVTSIGRFAFSGCSSLTSITIPSSVTSIGERVFVGCSSLTSVTIPNSVTSIGEGAFWGCGSLTSVTIPNSVTRIGGYAFTGCSSLTSVTIPNSVTSIGEGAFNGCSSLTSITIPNSVTSIGEWAFSDCSSLTSITIPNSVTSIGGRAFDSCISLTSVTIPNSVTSIGGYAFEGCSSLTSVTIPNSVTSIGESAFNGCISLTSITIPSSVTSIGEYTFSYCSSLTSITIPNSVTSIGESAFEGCSSLTSITIPSSVTSIGRFAFSDCSSLTSITIPSSVTSIGERVFVGCSSLTSVTIPNSVTSIGEGAFWGCGSLTSVTIPSSVTSIGERAFYDCSSLTSVTIPKSVSSIGENAFACCRGLERACFYGNAPDVWPNTFSGCESTFCIYYMPGTTGWTDGSAYDVEKGTWNGYPLKTWDGKTSPEETKISVPTGKYCIRAIDESGNPVSDATVWWNGSRAVTDENGDAFVDLTTAGEPVIRVVKSRYIEWTNKNSNWKKSDTRFEQVILYPESYGKLKLKYAKISDILDTNLVIQTKVLNLRNDGALIGDLNSGYFDLSCEATDTSDVTGYAVYQNKREIAKSTDGNFQKLDVRDFVEGGGCFVRVTGANGQTMDTRINLQFAKNSVNEDFKFELKGKKISFAVSDDIPYIGGTTLSFDMPLNAPVFVSATQDKLQFGINFVSKKLEGNSAKTEAEQLEEYKDTIAKIITYGIVKETDKKLLKNFMKQSNKTTFFKTCDVMVCGYAEADIGSKTASGNIVVIIDVEAFKHSYNTVMIIPVTLQIDVKLALETAGSISYRFNTETWNGNISMKPSIKLTPFLGVGASGVCGLGGYGQADLAAKWNILGTSSGFLQTVDLTGELGIKGYIGPLEAHKPFAHQTWHLYTANSVKSQSLLSGAAWDAAPEASAYAPSDLSYLAAESDWAPAAVRTYAVRAAQLKASYQTLLQNTYRNAQPVMISDGSALYAAFVRADADTGVRYIALTKFDGTSWSEPVRADAGAILDDAPQLCTDGQTLWLAYARTTQEPGDSLVAYAKHQNIVVGTVDKSTLAFTAQKTYQSNEYMHLPTLSCVNGTPVLAWVESAVTDEESVVNPAASTVYTAEYRGGAWLDARKAADAAGIGSICIGAQNGAPAAAYTSDGKLYCGSQLLAENVTGRAVYGRLPGTTADSFIWNADGALHDEAGNTVPVEGLGRDFVIVGDSIYFNQSNGANANLAALHYDAVNDHWSAPILLIDDEQYLENLNAAELNGKTYALGMHTTVTITADDVDDTKDLVWTQILPVSDLKLSDVSFDADALVPGETLPVTFTVTNSGDHTVSSLTLTANGVNTAQDCQLLPGESGEFTVNITCPSEKQIVTFEVQEPGQDDYTPEDNTAACTVGSADAEVELALLQIGSRKFLQAVVVNRGLEPASGSVLFTGPDGQTLAERTFQNLTYGGTVIAEYEPDSFAALYGEDVTATVRLQQDEPNMLNNTDSVPVLLTSTEILSAQRGGSSVTAEIACMHDSARALCAFYDATGRLLRTVIQPLESGKINSLTFQIDSNAAQAKLFVLDAKNAPAAPARSIPLNS